MPRTTEKTVYKFNELNDFAKERARSWWRECENQDPDFAEFTIDDAVQCGRLIGIEIATRPVKLVGGGTRQEPCIYWSGFSSQGDGACFDGRYSYAKGSAKAIRSHAPEDRRLHSIADNLAKLQRRHFYRLEASVRQSGHYTHSGCTWIEVTDSYNGWDTAADTADAVALELRDFMDWIYRQLESEYDYRMSDEQVDESIECNDYEFDESGRLAQ